MNETFLYYCFYLESNDINKPYELYAYTDSKKLAKRFKQERDMKKFIYQPYRLNIQEIHDITKNYREMYLETLTGKTKINHIGSPIVEFSIVVTKMEKLNVINFISDLIFSKLWLHTSIDPKYFKSEYQKALKEIGYTDGYEYFYSKNKDSTKSILEFGLEPDFLNTFLSFYKELMRVEK